MSVIPLVRRAGNWFTDQIIFQKLNNPLGFLILAAMAICIAYLVSILGKLSLILPVLIVGIPAVAACLVYMDIGIGVTLIVAFLIGAVSKMAEGIPFGMTLDALLFIMFLGLLIRQIKERDFDFVKHPISYLIMVWVGYNLLCGLNPWAESQMAWLFTVRSMAGLSLMFFVAAYAFKDLKTIFKLIKLIILLTFLSALYGLKQEFFGFSNWEMEWLVADEKRLQLIFQWSRIRIFSLFSDPTNFGILMAYMSNFCIVLMTGPFKRWQKFFLGLAAVSMILASGYAGSRTPFVTLPFGIAIFVLLKMDKRILLGTAIVGMLGFVVIMKGYNNAVLFRIQSAFIPSKSADTMDVRLDNQKMIQPFIHRHPIGAGLGSTGVWARRFTPHSWLSSFAHDSGFVRVAVELGWIGLIIHCLLLFSILKTCIYYYFRIRNPKIKVIYLGLTCVFFQLTLATYPQEAIVILPTSIIVYVFLAALVRMKDFDDPPEISKKTFGSYAKAHISVDGIPIDKDKVSDLSEVKGGRRPQKWEGFGINLDKLKGEIPR